MSEKDPQPIRENGFTVRTAEKTRFRHFVRIALVGGIVIHVLVFLFLKVTPLERPEAEREKAFVEFPQSQTDLRSRVLRERMLLFDPEPLFLPTRWNYAGNFNEILQERTASSVFAPYEPVFATIDGVIGRENREMLETVPTDPRTTLDSDRWDFFSTYGETAKWQKPAHVSSEARLLVRSLRDGSVVATKQIELPSGFRSSNRLLRPQSFVVTVTSSGPVGVPLRIRSTGDDVLDEQLGKTVAEALRSISLRSGEYRVVIGE